MKHTITCAAALSLAAAVSFAAPADGTRWKVHDASRPRPRVMAPPAQHLPVPAPADAVVLFDGGDLSGWVGQDGAPARWAVRDGVLTVEPGTGGISSRRAFGDVQLHLEWASPSPARGRGQNRGNSGVFLMGLYEVQILDSHRNETYADGQAAAVYGQYPPLLNVCRPAGEWQSYDIHFRRPRFDGQGKLLRPARITVVHNGVLVQDNVEVLGPTTWLHPQPYQAHPERLPLSLQEHGHPVRFRNIWARELAETPEPSSGDQPDRASIRLSREARKRLTGTYIAWPDAPDRPVTITERAGRLWFGVPDRNQSLEMVPLSDREFVLRTTDTRLVFELEGNGKATGFAFSVGGDLAFNARRAP